jgi:Uma2 family endonuclease
MATVVHESEFTVADLAERFGPIPLWRIRRDPAPGSATERDLLAIHAREKRLCELVDGILVEKPMGYEESVIAIEIARRLGNYVAKHKLGLVAGEGGMLKLARGLVRIPDVSFVSTARLPGGKAPRQAIPRLAPNLAIEVLSATNTSREMQRKLVDYFDAGVELVWFVDAKARRIEAFTAPDSSTVYEVGQTLTGEPVLPRFKLRLRDLFATLDAR